MGEKILGRETDNGMSETPTRAGKDLTTKAERARRENASHLKEE